MEFNYKEKRKKAIIRNNADCQAAIWFDGGENCV